MVQQNTANDTGTETIRRYFEQGFKVLRLHPETKRPVGNGWQLSPGLTLEEAERAVASGHPIGLQVGEVSGWLVCVDLDESEAVKLAPHFLPETLRAGKGGEISHYVYRSRGLGYGAFDDLDQARLIDLKASANGKGHQFVVEPSVHARKGPYEWAGGFDPAEMREVPARALREAVGRLAAACIIARHLPEKGRHRYSLALAGFLLRNGVSPETGARILRGAWWCVGAPGEHVESAGRNVLDTAEKLRQGERVIGGRVLEELVPGLARRLAKFLQFDAVAEPEEEKENPLLAGRVDMGAIVAGGIDPPEELEPDILLQGNIHHFFGPSESGKTVIALWLIKRSVEARRRVVLFDAENGARTIGERLRQMGADPKLLGEYLVYLPFPTLTTDARLRLAFEDLLDQIRPEVIVFDSWASFLSAAGFSENENSDVEHWDNSFTKRAKQRGITSVILDHVPHDGLRSRGAARKKEVADVQWRVKKTQEFNRDTVGEVLLLREKDREGWLPASVGFSIGGVDGTLLCRRSNGTVDEPSPVDGLTPTDRTVFATLCEEFGEAGARANEWQRATKHRGVGRTSHYRAVQKLVSPGLMRAALVGLENGTYTPNRGPKPEKTYGTSECGVDEPNSPRSQKVPNRSQSENGTLTEAEVPKVPPPYKGWDLGPTVGTSPVEGLREEEF
jgi:archaellum biogenesis ATPase FlaH